MSIAYAPGPRTSDPQDKGHFYIAWEQGGQWRPAACMPYVKIPVNIDPHLSN